MSYQVSTPGETVYRTADSLPLGADNLFDLCLRLRMACNGSADPISIEETHDAMAYLRRRLIHWTPSYHKAGERFDNCVRQLMNATIEEVEARYDWDLSHYRIAGVGVRIEPRPNGAECKSCKCIWYDPTRVGTPCPNFLCPDRLVGAAVGGAQ